MSTAIPGTFVPDIGTANDPATEAIPSAGAASGASFKSDQLSRDLVTGRTNDVSKVVTSVEEANLAMQFTLAIRNKLLDAYTEISRMQV